MITTRHSVLLSARRFVVIAAAIGIVLSLAASSLPADQTKSNRKADRTDSNRSSGRSGSNRTDENSGSSRFSDRTASNGSAGQSDSTRSSDKEGSASPSSDFDDYRLIVDRNIFDPSRRPSARAAASEPAAVRQPAETIDLLGTWISDRQALAFVEGSRPEHTGAPAQGDSLAGWRVDSVRADRVVLEKDGKKMDWPVGRRIERRDDGEWTVAGESVLSSRTSSSSPRSSSSASASSSTPAAAGSAEDLLRQMRERRQRETNP